LADELDTVRAIISSLFRRGHMEVPDVAALLALAPHGLRGDESRAQA
jgi:hypothetical protein